MSENVIVTSERLALWDDDEFTVESPVSDDRSVSP